MNLFSKKTLVTGTSIALLTATFALSPANISKTDNGINLSISTAEAATSSWEYVETKKKNTENINIATVSTAIGLATFLGFTYPVSTAFTAPATYILDKKLKTVYFKDKISMRMSGMNFQNKHEITMYSDSSYKNKVGETFTVIQNISAGPKSIIIDEEM